MNILCDRARSGVSFWIRRRSFKYDKLKFGMFVPICPRYLLLIFFQFLEVSLLLRFKNPSFVRMS
jgi:hypothetical protein